MSALVPLTALAASARPLPILLVHGLAWELERADPVWGELKSDNPNQPAWTGMIGFLESHGLAFGGEIQFGTGQLRLPEGLETRGVRVEPREARVFNVVFSARANTDGLAYKALELAEAIKQVCTLTGARKVRLLTHSAGGLVARAYLQGALPGVPYAGNVDRLVTLNAPHLGSAMAMHFGDLLGTRATSIQPDAPLVIQLNSQFELPVDVTFASIVIRGLGADERGDSRSLDSLVDQEWLAGLPLEYRTGGDQLIHVRSQNLRLARCAARYEQKTGRPIQYVLARVPYPSGRVLPFRPYIHAVSPSNETVQELVLDLLADELPLWTPGDPEKLQPWIDRQARIHAQGIVEAQALSNHRVSEVSRIVLDTFRLLGSRGESRQYEFSGRAYSTNLLFPSRKRWTFARGTMDLTFDKFGRVVKAAWKVEEGRDE